MIVVDTHAWYWWVTDDRRLSSIARGRLNRERDVIVPEICLWEVAMLDAHEKLGTAIPIDAFLEEALAWAGVRTSRITIRIGVEAARLGGSYKLDPTDALIASTATILKIPLVTRDETLRAIPSLTTVW